MIERMVRPMHSVYYACNADRQQLSPDVFTFERAMFYVAHLRGLNPGAVYYVARKHWPIVHTPTYTEGNQ